MLTFQADEVVAYIAHLGTVLAVNVARGGGVGGGHRLHSHRRVQESEVFAHVLRALLAQRAGVAVPTYVHGEAAEVHDVSALESTQGFRALEHGLVADGAIALESLGDAVVIVLQRYASITAHAVTVVNAQTLARSTYVAEWAVVYGFVGRVVVEVAYFAGVAREGFTR